MDPLFMNSENSKCSDSYRSAFNLTNKTKFKKSDKYIALSTF